MNAYGIIGYPLAHSFSTRYFTQKFRQENIPDAVYNAYPLASIGELTGLLKQYPSLKGLSVTIPYKKAVLDLLDDRSRLPVGLEACNCIKIRYGNLSGYNTDIIGFQRSLEPLLSSSLNKALILGTGGAAAAVAWVLKELNIGFKWVSREKKGDSVLTYAELDQQVMDEYRLIINTTPVGTFPHIDDCPPIPYSHTSEGHLYYDLVYNPEKTLFLQKGEEAGARIKNGYEMLVIQAEESWRIWNAD